MIILVLSDSHKHLEFMEKCIEEVHPDIILHLGDYYDDAETIHSTHSEIPMYTVPGNCDDTRCPEYMDRILVKEIGGVRIFMTHGHLHQVKQHTMALEYAAEQANCQVALYGHTHNPDVRHLASGLWIMNPGTAGFWGSSAGIIEIRDKKVIRAELIR